jgi:hypothetical protein
LHKDTIKPVQTHPKIITAKVSLQHEKLLGRYVYCSVAQEASKLIGKNFTRFKEQIKYVLSFTIIYK